MNVSEQGVREPGRRRHMAIPRTLVFLTSINPETDEEEVLLLKGAPTKRLWAGRYNGLGGHVEANEDVRAAARRELAEETGLVVEPLELRGVIHVDSGDDEEGLRPGILVFVFRGRSVEREVLTAPEGAAEWIPLAQVGRYPLVDDLDELLPCALDGGPPFFGRYWTGADGEMERRIER